MLIPNSIGRGGVGIFSLDSIIGKAAGGGNASFAVKNSKGIYSGVSDYSEISVDAPSGIQAGDLLLAYVAEGFPAQHIRMAGWKFLACQNTVKGSVAVYWRRATASEPSTYQFRCADAQYMIAAVVCLRGASLAGVAEQIRYYYANSNSTSIPTPEVTTSVDNCLILRMAISAYAFPATFTHPEGLTEIFDITNEGGAENGTAMTVGYEVQAAAGVSSAKTVTCTSAANPMAITIALKPATADAATVVSSSTTIKDNTTTAGSITDDFTAEIGDLIIAVVSSNKTGTAPVITGPFRWIELASVSSQGYNGKQYTTTVFCKVCDTNDPATYTFTSDGGSIAKIFMSFSGIDTDTPLYRDASTSFNHLNDTSHTFPDSMFGDGEVALYIDISEYGMQYSAYGVPDKVEFVEQVGTANAALTEQSIIVGVREIGVGGIIGGTTQSGAVAYHNMLLSLHRLGLVYPPPLS